MTGSDSSDADSGAVERPDSDDYDLLTFGEVAARLSEVLSSERRALEREESQSAPDGDEIRRLQRRIELLTDSVRRYERHQSTNEVFMNRFGFIDRADSDP